MEKIIGIQLEKVPPDVNKIIIREQARMQCEEDKKLKKPYVIYEVIRQWEKLTKHVKANH